MGDRSQSGGDLRRCGQHASASSSSTSTTTTPPCGACKFLRRKCTSGCIFAPYFGTDQGAARFAAVHKVFGASNVSKLLTHIPTARRHDAVVTISYEAQARLSDPVYGCVSTILALQHQVANLQAELSVVQSQLINSRLAVANALETSQQQQQEQQQLHSLGMGVLQQQPTYSNKSSASTTQHLLAGPINITTCCFANYDPLPASNVAPPPPPPTLFADPHLRLSNEAEHDTRAPHVTFANHILR